MTNAPERFDEWAIQYRVYNTLRKAGIDTPEKLLSLTISDVLALPGMGRMGLRHIREVLNSYGLKLRDYDR